MRHVPSNQDDIIDSCDIIARIAELESERDSFEPAEDAAEGERTWAEYQEDDAAELKALLALQDECEGYSDWHHGETLIAKSYFTEYAEQLAEDIGAVNRDATWPNNYIDWDAAAEALSEDYAEVDFDGEPFYIRNC